MNGQIPIYSYLIGEKESANGNSSVLNESISQNYFPKRSFNIPLFKKEIRRFFRHRKSIVNTMKSNRISRAFMERIMIAITAVNKCRYCSFVHTKFALENGCTEQEIRDIAEFNYDGFCEEEAVALAFCQHYAETNRKPSQKAIKRLIEYYGVEKARDIYNIISMIYFGNLIGNTVDAFTSRLKGKPPKNGSILLEFIIYVFGGYFFKKYLEFAQKKQAA